MTEVGLINTFQFFGVVLLIIAVISTIVEETARHQSNKERVDNSESAEATLSTKAIRLAGRPSFVFGIVCLVVSFICLRVAPKVVPPEEVLASVSEYVGEGEGALLLTLPRNKAIPILEGKVVVWYSWGFHDKLKVSGGLLSANQYGPFSSNEIGLGTGGQVFLLVEGEVVARISLLSKVHASTVVLAVHPIVPVLSTEIAE